jgi:hypothetical protein
VAIRLACAPVPCVVAHCGKHMSLLNGQSRTCTGEQEYIAGSSPIWTSAHLVGFSALVSGHRLTRKNQIDRAFQLSDRTAGATRFGESSDHRHHSNVSASPARSSERCAARTRSKISRPRRPLHPQPACWRNRRVLVRWIATGLVDAQQRFRCIRSCSRIRGCSELAARSVSWIITTCTDEGGRLNEHDQSRRSLPAQKLPEYHDNDNNEEDKA